GQDFYQFRPSAQGLMELRLIADGPGGQDDARITLEVLPPLPPTVNASIDRQQITLGEVAMLQWRSEDADHVLLQGLGQPERLPPSGQREVKPDRKGAQYLTLIATGPGGETKRDIRLEVLPPPAPKIIILETPLPPRYSS